MGIAQNRLATCARCEAQFTALHPRSKFCSEQCYKEHDRERQNAKRAADPDRFRSIGRATYARNRETIIASVKRFAHSDRGRELQRSRSAVRRATEQDKIGARTKLNNALRYGKVVRGPCRDCGCTDTHGHHHDYSKPLDVIWLCQKHHVEEHGRIADGR